MNTKLVKSRTIRLASGHAWSCVILSASPRLWREEPSNSIDCPSQLIKGRPSLQYGTYCNYLISLTNGKMTRAQLYLFLIIILLFFLRCPTPPRQLPVLAPTWTGWLFLRPAQLSRLGCSLTRRPTPQVAVHQEANPSGCCTQGGQPIR